MKKNPARKKAKNLILLCILLCAMALTIAIIQYEQILRSKAQTMDDCLVSDKLVNSCRPWLGGYANTYPGHADTGLKDQVTDHENRIRRQVDVVHYYHNVGSYPLNADEKAFINRPNTYALINWKPVAKWADAGGGNAGVNAKIDQVAESIKSVAPHKVMLAVHHEPENDISSGVTCAETKGSAGSPSDYVNMWHNVRARFDAKGVDNVVWSYIITGFKGWFCTLDALYPGDNYVDWIMFDIYGGGNDDPFDQSAQDIYTYLTQNSNASHNYVSKPWGIAETSNFNTDKELSWKYWDDAKAAVESNKYPNIKLWAVFDSKNEDGDFRIAFDKGGAADPVEQEHYIGFANSQAFAGTASMSATIAATLGPLNTPIPTCAPKDTRRECLVQCTCANDTEVTCEQGSVPACKKGTVCTENKFSGTMVSCVLPTLPPPPSPPCEQFDSSGNCKNISTAIGGVNVEPSSFISKIAGIIFGLAGGIALIIIIHAGYLIMTSVGKEETVKKARQELTAAIVGLLFLILSFVILEVVAVDILRIPGFG